MGLRVSSWVAAGLVVKIVVLLLTFVSVISRDAYHNINIRYQVRSVAPFHSDR